MGSLTVIWMLVLTSGYLLDGTQATVFKNVIAENGSRFRQKILVDRKTQLEIFLVPAHHGLDAIKEMYDFKRGLVARCTPKLKTCFLSEFNRTLYEYPSTLKKNMVKFNKMHIRASKAERQETFHNEKLVIVDVNPVQATNLIAAKMRKFIGRYKLYRESKLPANAEIIKDTGEPLVKPKRTKRNTDCRNKCRNNANPVVKQVLAPHSGYYSCDRVQYCHNGQCHWKHLTRNNYYQCCCCPEHTTPKQCYQTWGKCTYHSYRYRRG